MSTMILFHKAKTYADVFFIDKFIHILVIAVTFVYDFTVLQLQRLNRKKA